MKEFFFCINYESMNQIIIFAVQFSLGALSDAKSVRGSGCVFLLPLYTISLCLPIAAIYYIYINMFLNIFSIEYHSFQNYYLAIDVFRTF